MKTTPKLSEIYLGEINTRIAGMQYVNGEGEPGEELHLERQPDNPHDPYAIRVQNREFEDIGFIPRELTFWLAKLVDAGKVMLSGFIPEDTIIQRNERHRGLPLRVKVFLSEKGHDILQPKPSPKDEIEALHEVVRSAYMNLEQYASSTAILGLAEQLKAAVRQNAAPETRLLLVLFPHKAEELHRKRHGNSSDSIRETFAQLSTGKAIHYQNLTLFPLHKRGGITADYMLLKTALDEKKAVVEEVSEAGSVGELILHNRGTKPILLPEGEILTGAKQNRVINITLIIAAKTSTRIPVSCVERGRWQYQSRQFESTNFAHPKLRSQKVRSVWSQQREGGFPSSDQSTVWEEVETHLHCLKASSPTASVTDGYHSAEAQIRDYREKIILPEDAVGAIICRGNKVIAMDSFDSPAGFRQCWPRIADSYYMEAVLHPQKERKTPETYVQEFLHQISEAIETCEAAVGLGESVKINTPNLAGAGVWYENSLCHLSVFALSELSRK